MKALIHNDLRVISHDEIPMFLKTVTLGKLQPKQLITHHFTLDEVMQAYDTFDGVMKEEALRVILINGIMKGAVSQVGINKEIPFPVVVSKY